MIGRPGKFRVRTLMVAVALVAAALGGWRQYWMYDRLRAEFQYEAEIAGLGEQLARQNAKQTHDQWVAQCEEVARSNRDGPFEMSGGIRVIQMTPWSPEVYRRQAEYYARMRAKYEAAARNPWRPLPPDETFPQE